MAKRSPLEGLRALVVEDEYFIADDLERVLRLRGAACVWISGDIDDAFRRIERDAFDVALLDLNMHGRMDFLLADELLRRRMPFGLVSGYGRAAIPRRFHGVPNWGKPYDDEELARGVRRLWASAGRA